MRPKEAIADVTVDQIKEQVKGIGGAEGKKAVQRDRRAQNLAAMGLVTREGSRYFVKTAAARGRQESYEVWRDENGRVRCSCAEFERLWAGDQAFRCEHILAVKHSLAANNVEQTEVCSQTEQTEVCSTSSKGDNEMNDEEKEITQAAQTEPKPKAINPEQTEVCSTSAQIVPLAFANLLRTLRQPIDSRLIKTREGWTDRQGNAHWVEYIEWHTVADILDRVAPDWSHAVRNLTQIGDLVAVTAAITID